MKPRSLNLPLFAAAIAMLGLIAALASPNLDLARQLNQAFVEVAEKVSPSVVVITVTQKPGTDTTGESSDPDDSSSDEFWREFHERLRDSEESVGQASGIIIRENGFILTNGHVVENAEKIEVRLKDGRRFAGTVRGVDTQSDVAVIKIDARNLPVAKLADSAKIRVGEFAIAIGAPFSLDYSVTFGHVSAKGRANIVPVFLGGGMMDQDFIQTDANINPGNSGGPLVNIEGEVIGMNTLIRGLHSGIGFAVPSNLAREIGEELIVHGKFTRAWLGVGIHPLKEDADLREKIKGVDDGVVVHTIMPDGPAAKSQLRTGDVITAVDGHRVSSAQDLRNEVRGKKPGQPIALEVFRKDKVVKVSVAPGEYVDRKPLLIARRKSADKSAALGLRVQWFTQELADKFKVKLTEGVIVTDVNSDSPAALRGIKRGDVITSINHERTLSPAQFRDALDRKS